MNSDFSIVYSSRGHALYVHIPFCRSRCLYCSFFSSVGKSSMHAKYVNALKNEVSTRKSWILNHAPVRTLYFGGGTPSMIDANIIVDFIDFLRHSLGEAFCPKEITLEVNPEDVTEYNFKTWLSGGINRFSMGIQSLNCDELRMIGRRHSSDTALKAASLLKNSGNLSVDLICGLPGQTMDSFLLSLDKIISLQPHHISIYILELEKNSALSRLVKAGKISLPAEDITTEMYLALCKKLSDAGYDHYEISNFAKPGYQSLHNSSYWDGTPYLGLGSAAAGYTSPKSRYVNIPDVRNYIKSGPSPSVEILSNCDVHTEYILTHLRTSAGIELSDYNMRFGDVASSKLLSNASKWIDKKMLSHSSNRLRLASPEACLISDAIISTLI